MFTLYKDINGDSNVESYLIGPDFISVKFYGTPQIYTYSYRSAGSGNVEIMKRLAESGDGLNAYINTHCRKLYER